MEKDFGPAIRRMIFPILILLNLFVFAQQKDHNNSLNIISPKDSLHHQPDTNRWLQPDITAGMYNHFIANPGFCGSGIAYSYNTACNVSNPFYTMNDPGYHPFSFFASFEFSAGKKKTSGFGTCFLQSREGPRILNMINNSYSYKIQLGKYNQLRLGVSLNVFYNYLKSQYLTLGDMIDPSVGFVYYSNEQLTEELKTRTWNMNAGFMFSRKQFYFGFSALNLFKPLKNNHPERYIFKDIDKSATKFVISSGYTFELSPKISLSPSVQIRFTAKQFTADIHLTGLFCKHFIAGVSLNKLKTISADLGCSFWNIMTFYVSGGISTNSELYNHFGPLDYVSANLKIELGKNREKF